jgi:hypothetical protein
LVEQEWQRYYTYRRNRKENIDRMGSERILKKIWKYIYQLKGKGVQGNL